MIYGGVGDEGGKPASYANPSMLLLFGWRERTRRERELNTTEYEDDNGDDLRAATITKVFPVLNYRDKKYSNIRNGILREAPWESNLSPSTCRIMFSF